MTLMKSARSSQTPEIEEVAKKEGIDTERLRRLVSKGRVVIPQNPRHSPKPVGIGEDLSIKVNANLGSSPDHVDLEEELEKAKVSIEYGSDTIMDLSTGGDIDEIRRAILKETDVPLGTVPIYQAGLLAAKKGSLVDMSEDEMFNGIEKHAKDGVDFMTVHCGVTMEGARLIRDSGRKVGVVSRGGSWLVSWILHNGMENPLYSNFDYLLEMAKEHEFAISLGDGLRPGCIADATDAPQLQELIVLGELVKRAREADVQTMVEGPGHVPLNQIEANVRIEKTVCDGAPFYVLGPLPTDIAAGFDHLAGAIGGALAGYYGADFLCYMTPAEHISLPTVEDVKQGVIGTKIAAHVADLARGRGWEIDMKMAKARKSLDWDEMFKYVLNPEMAKEKRKKMKPKLEDTCSMCGDVCAIKLANELVK
ncbi:MAG: phosphomethylpyrimidine synthase ThiC [Methanobacteriota archaeon]|nr:MAG: phosphomethylpyrimidine synthase ThiC [Euryarchaeota archaeon]